MKLNKLLESLKDEYDVVSINLDEWYDRLIYQREVWLKKQLSAIHKEVYEPNERVLLTLEIDGDHKHLFNTTLRLLSAVDISDFFVIVALHSTDNLKDLLPDERTIRIIEIEGLNKTVKEEKKMAYDYNDWKPVKISEHDLNATEVHQLRDSKTFCIYPWMHLHTYPTGETYPCCHADMQHSVGSTKVNTLQELWNSKNMKELRNNMLCNKESPVCMKCYEQDDSGFFSGRKSANKHHGHHIDRISETESDGQLDEFKMTYWDIRFSNLCNLSCRSCGHIFSSSWYKDQVALAGPDWARKNKALNIAGQHKTDMIEQVLEHIEYVEQIYFAGGEPLMMEEHYMILDELERREMFDVRLVYNTNFTQVKLKDRSVFDYWRKFKSVSVGASLDAMGTRAEYIRKGTKWDVIEDNRREMLEVCPEVDFYISPTLSILNALHITDFHKAWVKKGFIKPQDLNVNILQGPEYYRIDIAPPAYKVRIRELFEKHIKWLKKEGDPLGRATTGFESALNFLDATDNTHLIPEFWDKINELDDIRGETYLDNLIEIHDVK